MYHKKKKKQNGLIYCLLLEISISAEQNARNNAKICEARYSEEH